MGGFGSVWHWVIVLLVIVLLFGAKKIPELAKGLGSGIKNFKKAVKEDGEDEGDAEATPIVEEKPKVLKAQAKKSTASVPKEGEAPKKRGRKPKAQVDA
ncbi:Sec-independent protein translocase TatA [Helicobacter sp. 12S02634-8]|uniref:twin-arginine translocase TatA/TatE family subunit n=1 Tax=Helicobacter sp. 12S02634-8 TaxID=1476199 RepID=UPI000BA5B1E5|nr:twin-arginine translocase TatA/TatE family subunit [Helicobacter sp. 12S02634-8]PAF47540.1 Sec-independent protein translocase TatA [Helicobacter sp. 12S02634-8]